MAIPVLPGIIETRLGENAGIFTCMRKAAGKDLFGAGLKITVGYDDPIIRDYRHFPWKGEHILPDGGAYVEGD